jgi:hypothetical protein
MISKLPVQAEPKVSGLINHMNVGPGIMAFQEANQGFLVSWLRKAFPPVRCVLLNPSSMIFLCFKVNKNASKTASCDYP